MLVLNHAVMQGQRILSQFDKRIKGTTGTKNRNGWVAGSVSDVIDRSKNPECRVPQCVSTAHPGCLSWWWTSGMSAQVKHCRRRRVLDYWSDPSHIQASGKRKTVSTISPGENLFFPAVLLEKSKIIPVLLSSFLWWVFWFECLSEAQPQLPLDPGRRQ